MLISTENIMLNKLSKTQKNKYLMVSHIWGTQMTQASLETKGRLVNTRIWVQEGMADLLGKMYIIFFFWKEKFKIISDSCTF